MTRILVTGASGLLGLNFALRFHQSFHVTGVVHQHVLNGAPFEVLQADLADAGGLDAILKSARPDVVLHCAALANLDACEQNPQLCWQVNVDLPEALAKAAARGGFKLVHLSTDAVFDGQQGNYDEDSPPNPLSTYARSKLAAEERVLQACPQALLARVNFYGWSLTGSRSLGEFFFYNLSAGKQVNGFTDVIFCPLEATMLADLLLKLVERDCAGIFHVVSSECLSKYAFGCAVADKFGLDQTLIRPLSVNESGLLAARSPDLRLRTEKLADAIGEPPPRQAACLDRFHELFQSGYPQYVRSLSSIE